MARSFYCLDCKQWIKIDHSIFETANAARKSHEALCKGTIFAEHPDLLSLDVQLEFFFGDN